MFADRFIQIIQDKAITPYRIAKETGISQGLMSEYKSGKKLPTLQDLAKIADYLGCSVDYLLGRTDNPDSNKVTKEKFELFEPLSIEEFELLVSLSASMVNIIDKFEGIDFETEKMA